ncbi:hypothetical protein DEJ25_08885 [Curtobacterium sp. MCPF17_011]|uniref:hypothetical protein n=1 Tax=Curtobacterium sp. MCPF17_011 TaxID=2175652 RepID=UPI000DAA3948|nr:hypothetical protein [Curtobacterium sp. MCPF17_011]PZF11950.1 hypothetical protein DEJ25_08885 [Curtobacterium sp. MCPF17_011]
MRGWRWLLVAAPVVLWALLLPLAPSLPVASRPGLERLPLLLAVLVAALVAPRAERAGARQSVAVPPGS